MHKQQKGKTHAHSKSIASIQQRTSENTFVNKMYGSAKIKETSAVTENFFTFASTTCKAYLCISSSFCDACLCLLGVGLAVVPVCFLIFRHDCFIRLSKHPFILSTQEACEDQNTHGSDTCTTRTQNIYVYQKLICAFF